MKSKTGLLPSRDDPINEVSYFEGKVMVDVGIVRVELEIAEALAIASKIICICEVIERGRHTETDSSIKS